jgi:hypothetical protein
MYSFYVQQAKAKAKAKALACLRFRAPCPARLSEDFMSFPLAGTNTVIIQDYTICDLVIIENKFFDFRTWKVQETLSKIPQIIT